MQHSENFDGGWVFGQNSLASESTRFLGQVRDERRVESEVGSMSFSNTAPVTSKSS